MIKKKWKWLSWDCEWLLWMHKPLLKSNLKRGRYWESDRSWAEWADDLIQTPRETKYPALYKRNGNEWERVK